MIAIAAYCNANLHIFKENPISLFKSTLSGNLGLDGHVHVVSNGQSRAFDLHYIVIPEEYPEYKQIILNVNTLLESAVAMLEGFKVLIIYNGNARIKTKRFQLIVRKTKKGLTGEFGNVEDDYFSENENDTKVSLEYIIEKSKKNDDERSFLNEIKTSLRDHSLYLFGYEPFKVTKHGIYEIVPLFKNGKVEPSLRLVRKIKNEYDQIYARRILSMYEVSPTQESKEHKRMIIA